MADPQQVSRVLVITAHPDDVDFGAAGTIAQWTEAGLDVSYCIVTNGDAGGSDRSLPRAEMAAIRQAEQTAAAKQVGVHDLHFLGYPDGRVEPSLALRRDLARVIRLLRPDRVVCQSPERNYAPDGCESPRSPGGRIRGARRRVPGLTKPVRVPRTPQRGEARAVDRARGLDFRQPGADDLC